MAVTSELRDRIVTLMIDDEWRTTGDMARELRMPSHKVSKIVQRMKAAGELDQDRAAHKQFRYRLHDDSGPYVPPKIQPDPHPLSLAWSVAYPAADLTDIS